ncbi:outer membrane beta-barrel protein [Vibrio tapetis]|uniref:Outer membrane protein beta-barrel domain-containing protein n=1 Tax=Vibrio tapetis subsp. tapetis TaxID=1671868 RepID=A0A2N8ZA60_9VIBR|nr:outer membrane beta-barrel protein [Vibrio tapetis]SON48782.1 exported protein of unknown function [Vibrio tapetis subsp. tapetis]
MKKLLIATAILASSAASANVDFTLLGGIDTQNGLNLAAEVGFGQAVVGVKGLGSIEETLMLTQTNTLTGTQNDTTVYGGYRLGNGMAIKAGAVFSSYDVKITGTSIDDSRSTIRPMVGFGYDFSDNFTMDVHYTASSELNAEGRIITLDDSFTFLAGYRF